MAPNIQVWNAVMIQKHDEVFDIFECNLQLRQYSSSNADQRSLRTNAESRAESKWNTMQLHRALECKWGMRRGSRLERDAQHARQMVTGITMLLNVHGYPQTIEGASGQLVPDYIA